MEPFSMPARRAVARAQEVAHLFGSPFVGAEHMAFALGEGDDDVGHLLAKALDREAIRERLGAVAGAPVEDMAFSGGAKRSIAGAFEHARRLGQHAIEPAHLALGVLDDADRPRLLPAADPEQLREALERVACSTP